MTIAINEDLRAYIDPLTPEEAEALERSLLTEGCRDALVLWGDVLVDGHNRYRICTKHGLPFETVQNPRFRSIDDVHLWMIDQHLGRRSVSDFQRGVLALRKKEIVTGRAAGSSGEGGDAPFDGGTPVPSPPMNSREALAKAARLSSNQIVMIEKIRRHAAPEVVEAVRSGTISINAAAAVAGLPAGEQSAAAAAGKDELRQAAKRVRESKRKPRAVPASEQDAGVADDGDPVRQIAELHRRVAELEAENQALRRQIGEMQV